MSDRRRRPQKQQSGQAYPVLLRPLGRNEGWLAEIPDLPGCMTDGETREDALAAAESAIAEWIAAAEEMGRPVPQPGSLQSYSGKWVQRVPKSLHAALAATAAREGVSLNQLVTAFLAEGLGRRTDPS